MMATSSSDRSDSSSPTPPPKERPGSNDSAASSSVGWNPDGEDDKSSIPSAASTSASKSLKRKRKRSQSNASSAWNPDWGSDEDSEQSQSSSSSSSEPELLPSQLPSQIDFAISSKVVELQSLSQIAFEEETDLGVSSKLQTNTKPPERIRYEMLGAPTLLYRHAPSYLDPSNRPSTLTPQQLSMALYMNEHPIKDWFTDNYIGKQSREKRTTSRRSAFLTSDHVPQPARPWGRPHYWDCRHNGHGTSSKSKTVQNLKRQAQLDANDLTEGLNCANRQKARSFWKDVEERNRAEMHLPPMGNLTGFNAFCADYINRLKESTSGSDITSGPQHHFELACKAWNELSRGEQLGYDRKAEALNRNKEGDDDDDQSKSSKSKQKISRKGRTTGFNLFRSEYRQTNPLDDPNNASADDRNAYAIAIRAHWKDMPEIEKSVFRIQAKRENEMRSMKSLAETAQQQESRKRKVTGWDAFRTEFMQSITPAADATDDDIQAHLMEATELASSEWKEMTAKEKSVYNDRANAQNEDESRIDQSSTAQEILGTEEDDDEEQHSIATQDLSIVHKNKGKSTGFHVFRSEYTLRWKESNPDASDAERKYAMIKCCKEASADWKEMSASEKSVYHEKAKVKNDQSPADSKQKRQKDGRKGRTTGFNLFRSESMNSLRQSNPLPESASKADRKEQFKRFTKETSAAWKGMPDAEKSPYKQDAERQNELLFVENAKDGDTIDSQHRDVASRTNSNKTNVITALSNGKGLNPESEQLVGERIVFESDVGEFPLELETTDKCDNFSPFRRQDVAIGFNLGDDMPLETINVGTMESLPVRGRKTGSDDERSEENEGSGEAANLENDEIRAKGETDMVQLQRQDINVQNQPISEDSYEDRHEVGGPSGYGNCLITVPCGCQYCESHSTSWFLIHPAGDYMSCVAMSKLQFSRDSSFHGGQEMQNIDVGGRILQIAQCGTAGSKLKPTNQKMCLVIRTSQYCSVIHVKVTSKSSIAPSECSTELHMHEKTRIDLRAPFGSVQPSYLPVYATCDPTTTVSFFTCPTFAILTRNYSGNCTTIHRVSMRDEAEVKSHSLSSSLADCSLIEFDHYDKRIMWAAARSASMPKLSSGFFKARSGIVTGYGHSLFRIDLRNDCAHHVWSPSHAEHLTEGLHSINGIMPDHTREHVVWVSSSSACKVWALDVRYKSAKVVVSWSLPSLCDDYGPQMSVTGIYGGGVLMCQPVASPISNDQDLTPSQKIQPPVLFSLKKDPNSYGVNAHQFPSTMPRFQAKSLESAGCQEVPTLKYKVSSIARSSIFPLPDVSSSIFNIGLASLQCSSKVVLNERQLNRLGYRSQPANVTLLISMTSLGDIYCHSLLETDLMEETQACQFPGLPVGTKAIPLPSGEKEKSTGAQGILSVSLSNKFPIPSNAITARTVRNMGECCRFKSFDIGSMMNKQPPSDPKFIERDDDSETKNSRINILSACKNPHPMHDLIKLNKATKETVLNLPYDEHFEAFRVASHGGDDDEQESAIDLDCGNDNQVSIRHPLPRFGLARAKEATTIKMHYCPINLHSSHIGVAVRKEEETDDLDSASDASDNRPNMEIRLNLLNNLKSNFFNDSGNAQVGVKDDWSTGSE